MAGNSEPSHIPQQNRRNKLRVTFGAYQDEEQTSQSQAPPFLQLNQPTLFQTSPQSLCSSTMQNTSQGLSLSLSFQHHDNNMNLPFNLDEQNSKGNNNNNNSIFLGGLLKQNGQITSSVPLGPFTGYAYVLKSSRFLKPAQQILDGFCGVDCRVLDIPLESLDDPITCSSDRIQHRWKNSRLILMLDEVNACLFLLKICTNLIKLFAFLLHAKGNNFEFLLKSTLI